jgi:hypothetical protein
MRHRASRAPLLPSSTTSARQIVPVRRRLSIGRHRPRRARDVGSAPSRSARRPVDHVGGDRRAADSDQAQHVLEHMRQTIRLPRDRHAHRRHQADPPHRIGIHIDTGLCKHAGGEFCPPAGFGSMGFETMIVVCERRKDSPLDKCDESWALATEARRLPPCRHKYARLPFEGWCR